MSTYYDLYETQMFRIQERNNPFMPASFRVELIRKKIL